MPFRISLQSQSQKRRFSFVTFALRVNDHDPASPIPPTRPKGFRGGHPKSPRSRDILGTLFFNRSFWGISRLF